MLEGEKAHCDYLECAADAVALLVDDEAPVLHPPCCEEADVARAGEFLRGTTDVVGGRGDAVGWADDVEVVGYQRFVRDEQEEGEVFENGDLCDAWVRDDSLPAPRVVVLCDVDAEVCAYGEHLLSARLVEACRAVHSRTAYWCRTASVVVHLLDVADCAVERNAFDDYARLSGYCAVVREC